MANAPTYLNHSGVAEDAQGVIIVNPDGTFADMSGGVGGGGGTIDGNVGILDDADVRRNPMTEETGQAIVDELTDGTIGLGKAAASASLPVVQAEDPAAAATISALASSASSAQLLASTAGRRGLTLYNTDANGVYVKYGTTASATSFTVLIPASGYWEMPRPIYTGRIDAIWAADGSGSLYATELT